MRTSLGYFETSNTTDPIPPSPFIAEWVTTGASETITLPLSSDVRATYDFEVDWGGGAAENAHNTFISTHNWTITDGGSV